MWIVSVVRDGDEEENGLGLWRRRSWKWMSAKGIQLFFVTAWMVYSKLEASLSLNICLKITWGFDHNNYY